MDVPSTPRQRPKLPSAYGLLGRDVVGVERELAFARGVANGSLALTSAELTSLCVNLLASLEENRRVTVGYINENKALKARLAEQPERRKDDSDLIPGLQHARDVIDDAIKDHTVTAL